MKMIKCRMKANGQIREFTEEQVKQFAEYVEVIEEKKEEKKTPNKQYKKGKTKSK